ncbi:nucleotide-diphosphate-sugar epimerase [Streptomyces sulfonofaciens]|uniref:Nucleotide-diphosphate-sugar epimerase n=1 Tax=Streptomyces sulfonofaciens TaxID=68272 RepID=A0A919G5Z9_9ACTN|nr:NAD(P)H-binding protein [Streptomyces sulfonofaciens]GHH78605.1 nucleotide-diphosphate-sugar epimerase [Streptomyces sulfonofaciens]
MIVVTGATGNIGRGLVDRLLAEGASVRALSRDPGAADLPDAVDAVRADLGDPSSLGPVLGGAEAVYLNLAAAGMRGADQVVKAIAEAGVKRIVLNSSIAVTIKGAEEGMIARAHSFAERAVRDSGLEWTFVRGGMYATNALQWAAAVKEDGVVRGPYPDAVAAPVHEADLAAVSARALLDGSFAGTAPVITGPAAITPAEQVAAIGRAIGRETRFERISPQAAAEALSSPHFPADAARQLVDFLGSTVGTTPEITGEVERITGRPARTFEEWAADHADDFR